MPNPLTCVGIAGLMALPWLLGWLWRNERRNVERRCWRALEEWKEQHRDEIERVWKEQGR